MTVRLVDCKLSSEDRCERETSRVIGFSLETRWIQVCTNLEGDLDMNTTRFLRRANLQKLFGSKFYISGKK